jgi:hypothetical protein
VIGRKWVTWVNLLVNDKGFISFAAERAGGKKSNPEAAKVMKPCSELNLASGGSATTGYERPPSPAALGPAAGTGCPKANFGSC